MTTSVALIVGAIGLCVAVALSVLATRRMAERKQRAFEQRDRVAYEREQDSREELLTRLRRQIVDEEALDVWETVPYETVTELVNAHRAVVFDTLYRQATQQQRDLFDHQSAPRANAFRGHEVPNSDQHAQRIRE